MSRKSTKSTVKCRATRRYLLNGAETGNLQGIRVTIAYPQKRTLRDMAKSISQACTVTDADVLAVWTAMENEIIRALSDGNRVELGTLGTLSIEVGARKRKSVGEGITSSDIVFKGVTFAYSKRLQQAMGEVSFECDGIVAHPLGEERAMAALAEHFSTSQYINTRTFATLCKCSRSTALRRLNALVAAGKMRKSTISSAMYEWVE